MRHTLSILSLAGALVLAASLLFGWPGWIALSALAPGLLLGSTLAHGIDAVVGGTPPRPLRLVLGLTLGTFAAIASVLLMWAATAPEEIVVEAHAETTIPPESAWEVVGDPNTWTRWDLLVTDLEAVGRGGAPAPGDRYRSSLRILARDVPTEHVVLAWEPGRRIRWQLELPPGSALVGVVQGITLAPTAGGASITYRLAYRLPSITGRAMHRLAFEGELREAVRQSVESLAALLDGSAGG